MPLKLAATCSRPNFYAKSNQSKTAPSPNTQCRTCSLHIRGTERAFSRHIFRYFSYRRTSQPYPIKARANALRPFIRASRKDFHCSTTGLYRGSSCCSLNATKTPCRHIWFQITQGHRIHCTPVGIFKAAQPAAHSLSGYRSLLLHSNQPPNEVPAPKVPHTVQTPP